MRRRVGQIQPRDVIGSAVCDLRQLSGISVDLVAAIGTNDETSDRGANTQRHDCEPGHVQDGGLPSWSDHPRIPIAGADGLGFARTSDAM